MRAIIRFLSMMDCTICAPETSLGRACLTSGRSSGRPCPARRERFGRTTAGLGVPLRESAPENRFADSEGIRRGGRAMCLEHQSRCAVIAALTCIQPLPHVVERVGFAPRHPGRRCRTGVRGDALSDPPSPRARRHVCLHTPVPVPLGRFRASNPCRKAAWAPLRRSGGSRWASGWPRRPASEWLPRGSGDLAVAAPELVLQAQQFSNLPHGQPFL